MDFALKQSLLLSALVYFVQCDESSVYHKFYQLRDSVGTVNLEVALHSYIDIQAHIFCLNYNSLKYLEIQSDRLQLFKPNKHNLKLDFHHCFDNETDTENNNYSLIEVLNNLRNQNSSRYKWSLTVRLEDFAIVNSDVFFKDFDLKLFRVLKLHTIGFESTRFLRTLRCIDCDFNDNEQIDLNAFNRNMSETQFLDISCNRIINFNKQNWKKFGSITKLRITEFDLNNYNAFNVPALFAHNNNLQELCVKWSKTKIVLHENVFNGLKKLQRLWLVGLHLDNIPNNLFTDLKDLELLYLSSNNIKTLNPAIFENTRNLISVNLYSNPIFTGQPEQDVYLAYGSRSVRLTSNNH